MYESKTFLDFINDDSVNTNNEKIKIFDENKNISLLRKENEKYKNKISKLKKYIKELEAKLKDKDNIIKEEKLKYDKLNNKY